MNCPECNSEDFYIGDLSGPNCANVECENYKGGVVSTELQLDNNKQHVIIGLELDWEADEEKTPVIKYDDWFGFLKEIGD